MADEVVVEKEPQEEPDVPLEELAKDPSMEDIANIAALLVMKRNERKELEAEEDRLAEQLLPLMRAKELHGVGLPGGVAVRRRWNPSRPKINPTKLAARLADHGEFIRSEVVVDQAKLRKAYPTLWTELGGKVTEGVSVFEPKAKEEPKP